MLLFEGGYLGGAGVGREAPGPTLRDSIGWAGGLGFAGINERGFGLRVQGLAGQRGEKGSLGLIVAPLKFAYLGATVEHLRAKGPVDGRVYAGVETGLDAAFGNVRLGWSAPVNGAPGRQRITLSIGIGIPHNIGELIGMAGIVPH
jgi:hypothetical protein